MGQRQFRSDDTDTWLEMYGDGSDGALTVSSDTTDATPNTTITGTSGATAATVASGTGFANNDLVLIHQTQGTGAGQWELNKISSIGGGTNWTMAYTLTNTYATGAQVYKLKQYSSVTINSTKTLTGMTWAGGKGGILALLCNGAVTVTGNLSVSNKGFPGGANTNGGVAYTGESEVGGTLNQTTPNGSAGGGGEAGVGEGNDGTVYQTVAGLTTRFVPGGAGGGASLNGATGGNGGLSGGLVLIIGRTLTVTGGINANGQTGQVRSAGGGAGGCILLKGETLSIGSSLLTVAGGTGAAGSAGDNGGGGGAGSTDPFFATGQNGTNGTAGRIHSDYGISLTGTTTPTIDSRLDTTLIEVVINTISVSKDMSYELVRYKISGIVRLNGAVQAGVTVRLIDETANSYIGSVTSAGDGTFTFSYAQGFVIIPTHKFHATAQYESGPSQWNSQSYPYLTPVAI